MDVLITVGAVGLIVLVAGALAYLQRGGWQWLDDLPLGPGERVLAEVADVWVVALHPGPDRGVTAPGGIVRVTTDRLVVGQRALFSRRTGVVRYLVDLVTAGEVAPPASDPVKTLRQVYARFPAAREAMRLEPGKRPNDAPTLVVTPAVKYPPLGIPMELRLRTPYAETLLVAIQQQTL